jgi:hypothetical protein
MTAAWINHATPNKPTNKWANGAPDSMCDRHATVERSAREKIVPLLGPVKKNLAHEKTKKKQLEYFQDLPSITY